jgi:hypothetical protein
MRLHLNRGLNEVREQAVVCKGRTSKAVGQSVQFALEGSMGQCWNLLERERKPGVMGERSKTFSMFLCMKFVSPE